MIFLRSLAFNVALALSVLAFSVALLAGGRRLSYRKRCRMGRMWGRLVLWLLKVICRLEYRVEGLEQIPARASIILAKHQSAWETIFLRAILPLEQTWVLKRELTGIPFFGWALSLFDPIAIDRSAGRAAIKQLLLDGEKWLDAGRWIVIFPEGTRVKPGSKHRYGIGGAILAERSGAPVVPIAHNAGVFWGRRSLIKLPGVIDVVVGAPIYTESQKAPKINAEVEAWIEATVGRLPKEP